MLNDTYVETSSGTSFHFLDPQPDEIIIEDIAYALSNLVRFNGHGSGFLSVAEHSVLVALRLPTSLQLAGLLHDASEAYLSDIPSPVKHSMEGRYKEMEALVQQSIFSKFECYTKYIFNTEEIKNADLDSLRTEAYYLMKSKGMNWFGGSDEWVNRKVDHNLQPRCLPPAHAYHLFMDMFHGLTKRIVTLD